MSGRSPIGRVPHNEASLSHLATAIILAGNQHSPVMEEVEKLQLQVALSSSPIRMVSVTSEQQRRFEDATRPREE